MPNALPHHDGFADRKNDLGITCVTGTALPLMNVMPVVGISAATNRVVCVTASQLPQRSMLWRRGVSFGAVVTLLETDLALKSSGSLPPRVLLERLVVRLARPRAG